MSEVNCGIKRWNIDAPSNSQYTECCDGEWCAWDDVSAALMRQDGERAAVERQLVDALDMLQKLTERLGSLTQTLARNTELLEELGARLGKSA
jgi:hypothetical protein